MSPLRERLIAAGVLRPRSNELAHIQLPPGTVVFGLDQEPCTRSTIDAWDAASYAYKAWLAIGERPAGGVL